MYADPLGVTAAFNKNLLVRINHELGGHFDLDAFDHLAVWNAAEQRIEMHLVSGTAQTVTIDGAHTTVHFEAGERIWTESSYRYQPDQIEGMAVETGFAMRDQWIDTQARFALSLLTAIYYTPEGWRRRAVNLWRQSADTMLREHPSRARRHRRSMGEARSKRGRGADLPLVPWSGEASAPHVLRRRVRARVEDPQQSVVSAASGEEARQGDLPAVWRRCRQGAPRVDAIEASGRRPCRATSWRAARPKWEADHIVPVADGGGECGFENYRLLCRPCHVSVTLALAGAPDAVACGSLLQRAGRAAGPQPSC